MNEGGDEKDQDENYSFPNSSTSSVNIQDNPSLSNLEGYPDFYSPYYAQHSKPYNT